MPAGTTNGSIYVYDPVFCDVATNKGTGDRWFSGSNGVSSFYELYDTKGTLYDQSDDGAALATSGGLFRGMAASDTTMGGSGGSECLHSTDAAYGDGRDYHDNWYLLYGGMSGGANGHIYRIHTTSTDPANVNAQKTVNGENSFALYASATGGDPEALRARRDAGLHATVGGRLGRDLGVLPGPDRRGLRRQDRRGQPLGPGRHQPTERLDRDPAADGGQLDSEPR